MSSVFGEDGVDDLLNDNVREDHELPSDDDEHRNGKENPFVDGADGEDAEGGGEDGADPNAVKVEPKKRSVRNPRPRLTVETLRGQRGLQTIEEYYKDMKFNGKGYEKQDLDEVMRRLQHWGHRMYPTYKFDDVLNTIERLGKKKPLQVHMNRYRLDMLEIMKINADGEMLEEDDEGAHAEVADEPFDEFDALLGEQIAISKLAPRTPASSTVDANTSTTWSSTLATPSFNRGNAVMSTPHYSEPFNDSDLAQPLPPSQPSTSMQSATKQLTAEQIARMAENRRIALERLQAKKLRLQQQQQNMDASIPQA